MTRDTHVCASSVLDVSAGFRAVTKPHDLESEEMLPKKSKKPHERVSSALSALSCMHMQCREKTPRKKGFPALQKRMEAPLSMQGLNYKGKRLI